MAKNIYDIDSIESLSPLEFTRLRPGVYAGDTTYSTQLLVEILSNAVDEFKLGHGNSISIAISDDVVTVGDSGQGFIVNSVREDNKTILEAAFSVLNTSGKYHEDGTYEGTSLGSFGIGSKITNYLSNWLRVVTWRDGQYEDIYFEEGVFKSRDIGQCSKELHGTEVTWKPSKEFFTHTQVEINKVKELLKTIVCLCPGLSIYLKDGTGPSEVFVSNNGLMDLADSAIGDKEIINTRFNMAYANGKNKLDMIIAYTSDYSSTIVPYVNTGLTEKGQHISQIKTIITREFNKFYREKKWLKEKDDNLSGEDIQEGMYIVFNITAPNVAYNAQVKSTITKIDMTPFNTAIAENIQNWLNSNEKEIKKIFDKAAAAKRAREAAKKARDTARGINGKKKNKLTSLPSKLVDANSKDRKQCELFIVEGDSASGGMIAARDPETQAVFPIRGKLINIFKNSDEKVFANQEVINIIKAIGLDFDSKTHKMIFDENKIRYGKIIPACDGDPDGQAIKNLLLTFFWSLCPELLTKGYIWIAVPPLFRITKGKDNFVYLKDQAALDKYKIEHQNEKYQVNRNKG